MAVAASRVFLALASLAVTGCGEPTLDPGDAGPDADAADTAPPMVMPEAPMAPAAASMLPCTDGWEARDVEGVATVCEPAGGALPTCSGTARVAIGESACREVGRPCGMGEWPDVSDVTTVVRYVREGATGGDGTMAAPYGTIREAATAAGAGDVIAIAAGSYGGLSLDLVRDVELRGVCAASVEIGARVAVARARVVVDGVSIVGANQAITVAQAGTLTVRGVAVLDASTIAVNVTAGSHLDATDLLVRNVLPQPSDGQFGWGINVDFGSDAIIRQSHVEGARGVAIASLVEGTEVRVEDTVVRGIVADANGTGRAVTVGAGARFHGARLAIDECTEFAIVVDGADAQLELEDSLVRRTRADAAGELGGGIAVQNAGSVVLRRIHFADHHRMGLQIAGRSLATIEDVVVTDTQPEEASGIFGRALLLGSGSDATVRRFAALHSYDSAILAAGGGTILRLEDVSVVDVGQVRLPDALFHAGRGLTVGFGARAEVARVSIEEAGDVGILTDDAELEGTDVRVVGTRGEESMGVLGHGMQTLRSRVTLTRARFERNRAAGVVVGVAPGTATLSELAIVGTLPRACAETTCADVGAGIGLTVLENAHADVSRFSITDGALCGLQLAAGGTADARAGLVTGHPIGANVQTEGFDIGRITADVHYDNDLNLDSSALPLPVVTEE